MRLMRIFFIFFCLLGLFGLNSTSLAVNWDYIGKNVKGTMLFVDTDSAEINAEHARVWVKMEYPDGASDIFLVVMVRRAKIIKYFSYAVYDKNGVITSAGDFYDGWKHIVPESGMEAVYKSIWPFY